MSGSLGTENARKLGSIHATFEKADEKKTSVKHWSS